MKNPVRLVNRVNFEKELQEKKAKEKAKKEDDGSEQTTLDL